MKNFWIEDIRALDIQYQEDEKDKLISYIRLFQNGDFRRKKEFVEFFLGAASRQIFVLGMRVFMAIAAHKDFKMLEDFFAECEEERLKVFLAYVQESMSLQAIPYLLALYGEWDETGLESDIARCICGMLGVKYLEEKLYTEEQLGELYLHFVETHDINKYYYKGELYFAGNLTKKIITIAMQCYNRKSMFYTNQMPSIISNNTGVKCPVSYGKIIDDFKIRELYEYVSEIAQFRQVMGEKYFYKFKIE